MKIIPLTILILLSFCACAQPEKNSQYIDLPEYTFINYDANHLRYDTASPSMRVFFDKWYSVATTGQGNLNIVHIGGSHVQAGTMSNTIRCNLMNAYPNLVGDRGMIFPYSAAAKCNNPHDYRIRCSQKVSLTRNVQKEYPYPLGVCGIGITTTDTLTEISVVLNDTTVDYATTEFVVLGHSDQNVVPLIYDSDFSFIL